MTLAVMCAAAGAMFLAARGQRVTVDRGQVSGATTPAAAALALVTLAGAGTLSLLDTRGRRIVAVLLVLVGAATTAVMLSIPDDAGWFAYSPGNQDAPAPPVRRSPWAWLGAGAGMSLVLAAASTLLRAPWWPGGGSNRDGARPLLLGPPSGSSASAWERIDRGEDPTV